MQTDKVAKARAVRRRQADMRMAAELRGRGWTCHAPIDQMQVDIERKAFLAEQERK